MRSPVKRRIQVRSLTGPLTLIIFVKLFELTTLHNTRGVMWPRFVINAGINFR